MAFTRHALFALLVTALLAGSGATPAVSHEFWIEPERFRVAPDQPIMARTLIGSHFLGEELANYSSMQRMVDLTRGDRSQPVSGPEEQTPALQAMPLGEGLHVLRYQSTNFQVTYDSYAKWVMFLLEAQRTDLIPLQDATGTRDNIREVYFRYAKSLVAVGDGQGEDRFLGMPLELVAQTNPYQGKPQHIRLRVFFRGEPAPEAAVHVFIRDDEERVTTLRLRTDAGGEVDVPAAATGIYMVNAIQILPASERMQQLLGASWQSLWASTTFEIR